MTPSEQCSLNVDVERIKTPQLDTTHWTEHLLITPIKPNTFLKPLEIQNGPLDRVHTDLLGPLTDESGRKAYVMTLIDSFSRYCVFVKVDNKLPATIAKAIFKNWICLFSTPLVLTSDLGGEYLNQVVRELTALLKIDHRFARV